MFRTMLAVAVYSLALLSCGARAAELVSAELSFSRPLAVECSRDGKQVAIGGLANKRDAPAEGGSMSDIGFDDVKITLVAANANQDAAK